MTAGVCGLSIILSTLSGLRGVTDSWKSVNLLPKGTFGVIQFKKPINIISFLLIMSN